MSELILDRFTKEDWNAFVSGYAGNEDLYNKVAKNPEYFEDEIHGCAYRKKMLEISGEHPDYRNLGLLGKNIRVHDRKTLGMASNNVYQRM